MTDAEIKQWLAVTENSRYQWTKDEVTRRNGRGSLFYFGGENGIYMHVKPGGALDIGTYEGALPHIGEAMFTRKESVDCGSCERHQPEDAPPWSEQRRLWTDAVLQGMARLSGEEPDSRLMEQFDRELEQAKGCYFFTPATQQTQKDTIRELRRFVAALEATGDDRRRQINVVRELLEDMSLHPHWWNGKDNGLDHACDEADRALVCMTAQMPIRFTYVTLGGDAGPCWASGFVSGSVMDEEAVQKYPEVTEWPALCTVYAGRNLPTALGTVDASEFDLEIMNRTGDRFLDERGVRWLGGPYQMSISTAPAQTWEEPAAPQMGLTM